MIRSIEPLRFLLLMMMIHIPESLSSEKTQLVFVYECVREREKYSYERERE